MTSFTTDIPKVAEISKYIFLFSSVYLNHIFLAKQYTSAIIHTLLSLVFQKQNPEVQEVTFDFTGMVSQNTYFFTFRLNKPQLFLAPLHSHDISYDTLSFKFDKNFLDCLKSPIFEGIGYSTLFLCIELCHKINSAFQILF